MRALKAFGAGRGRLRLGPPHQVDRRTPCFILRQIPKSSPASSTSSTRKTAAWLSASSTIPTSAVAHRSAGRASLAAVGLVSVDAVAYRNGWSAAHAGPSRWSWAAPREISSTACVSGRVTDFLLFYIGHHQWPTFNVADSAIVIGCGSADPTSSSAETQVTRMYPEIFHLSFLHTYGVLVAAGLPDRPLDGRKLAAPRRSERRCRHQPRHLLRAGGHRRRQAHDVPGGFLATTANTPARSSRSPRCRPAACSTAA